MGLIRWFMTIFGKKKDKNRQGNAFLFSGTEKVWASDQEIKDHFQKFGRQIAKTEKPKTEKSHSVRSSSVSRRSSQGRPASSSGAGSSRSGSSGNDDVSMPFVSSYAGSHSRYDSGDYGGGGGGDSGGGGCDSGGGGCD
ncbi:hypothetical protein D3C79_35100 [compost metagenome]